MNEQELCRKRLLDLSRQADRKGIVLFSDFLNLNECALQCGFLTAQYFCRVFKKATDMTPTEYRNQMLTKKR